MQRLSMFFVVARSITLSGFITCSWIRNEVRFSLSHNIFLDFPISIPTNLNSSSIRLSLLEKNIKDESSPSKPSFGTVNTIVDVIYINLLIL